jgi:hypothetical protein
MPLTTRRFAVLAALGLTLITTACSGDDDDTDPPADDAAADASDATETDDAESAEAAAQEVVTDGATGGGGATDLAATIYESTPVGVTEDDAACLASAVTSVVGEAAVTAAGNDLDAVYGTTTTEQDVQIASTAFECTSAEADAALAAEVGGTWPDAWNPA